MFWSICLRAGYALVVVLAALALQPVGDPARDVAAGALGALAVLAVERRLHRLSAAAILSGVLGAAVGLGLVRVLGAQWTWPTGPEGALVFLHAWILVSLPYLGLALGSAKPGWLDDLLNRRQGAARQYKVLDTSAIIDGRIADVSETGFLDGTLIVPQFVLAELQSIADSQEPMRRNRGRRGLEILHRIQKTSGIDVIVSDVDFPGVREVDQKLIELARSLPAKIVTNDFNLNRVAQLHGVEVLNVNDLANSLKPVVLPGEAMQVLILKEGKEHNQGVGYLDDGTMVVVDNARRFIGRTIAITVTSVLQTTAGKMIFGRHIEAPAEPGAERADAPKKPRAV